MSIKIAVWPDNTQAELEYISQYSHMSDDYVVRLTEYCEKCDQLLELDYDQPIASCSCGSQEWYK
jgi:hypothetical protein